MITLFATTKSFTDIFKTIQLNALNSWRALSNDIQIIIFGDSVGSKEAAERIGADYVPSVRCSPQGTPYLSDLFLQANKRARFPIMTFINADIILPSNFLNSISIMYKRFNKFLMVGHRWDMEISRSINFYNSKENELFWENVKKMSTRHACTGIDYFVYTKKTFGKLPDFIIGRPGFDNWMIWKARRRLIPIVDATEIVQVVHQNHHFNFHNLTVDPKIIPEGMVTKELRVIEGNFNKKLHKGRTLNILDCTHEYFEGKIRRKTDKASRIRSLHRLPMIFPELAIPIKLYRRLYTMFNYS